MIPRFSVVDPELTYSLPPEISASSGLDALTQLIEPFVCNAPNPITDAVCKDGIARASQALLSAYRNGQDAAARQDMSLASLFGGMALANARLGAVHGMASPIGGVTGAPHGAICAALLPVVMESNIKALQNRQSGFEPLERYTKVARLLTGDDSATAMDGPDWVDRLCRDMNIRSLSVLGLRSVDFSGVVAQSQKSSSMKGNPISLTKRELNSILEKAF